MGIITEDNWPENWRDVEIGTEVSEDVYDYFLNALPPIDLRQSAYCGFQMSEPFDHQADDGVRRSRARYLTFVTRGDRYFYAGMNFAGVAPIIPAVPPVFPSRVTV